MRKGGEIMKVYGELMGLSVGVLQFQMLFESSVTDEAIVVR